MHRRQGLRAAGILEEKARANPKLNFALDSVLEEIIGENRVEAVKIRNVKTDTCEKLPCSGVFIFVGIKPNTSFLVNYLKLDEAGFVVTDQEMKTSAEAIFACGDCRKKDLYQAINACAEGAVAAAAAHKYLL